MSDQLKEQRATSYLNGPNAAYVEALFEAYLDDPSSVSAEWRDCFDQWPATAGDVSHTAIKARFLALAKNPRVAAAPAASNAVKERQQAQVSALVNAYRSHGHHHATLDPLGLHQRLDVPALSLDYHQLTAVSASEMFDTNNFAGMQTATVPQLLAALQATYSGSIGVEFRHITNSEETNWIQQRLERLQGKTTFSPEQQRHILQKLTTAEGLEKYLGTRYVGQKRFSLEGGDSLIPLLDEVIQRAGSQGVKEIVMGMAHRGRLSVLTNILGKAPATLFDEFEGNHLDEQHSGDVKYHMGFSSDVATPGGRMHLSLAFNPSHLEIIDPVVEGSVRARQDRRGDTIERHEALPILIHGDAAFAGQGVVMETFSLSQARGFKTGGTLHVIVNNQIGFTTSNPIDSRSSLYCTDVAKMVQAPVLHVNADDPEAVIFATQIAIDYRMQFKKDVVLDLVCFRRHGHNEADEPSATQPLMYQKIRKHPTTRSLYGNALIAANIVEKSEVDAMMKRYRQALDQGAPVIEVLSEPQDRPHNNDWAPFYDKEWDHPADTGLEADAFQRMAKVMTTMPEGFSVQKQVQKLLNDRAKMAAGELPLDWGFAETMAYASLVDEQHSIRLVGQDACRGTFAHRHVVMHDQETGKVYKPLKHISPDQARFTVIDSLLSEEAVMGFEYGYASTEPNTLVIWEAQFGDFANGAQVVIDQFISSGEQKWGRLCGLTLLLPHGYEGQGPEHSSARLERYLQLCAQNNMQVCMPSTPAQMFHLLRRQVLRPYRKPLIVMTPKSLLRHKMATSDVKDLTDGHFRLVVPDVDEAPPETIKRVVLCSGKVFYDLLKTKQDKSIDDVAILRVEQLYPAATTVLHELLAPYQQVTDIIWCQEEPENQGAWYCVQHWLKASLYEGQTLQYAGRPSSASPAAGYAKQHLKEQEALVNDALDIK